MEETTIWQYETIQENAAGLPEAGLIKYAQNGDLGAFNQLVLSYQDRVFSLARWILGDEDLADDVTQITFVSAYRNLSRFRGGSFRGWLCRMATNACMDEIRKRKRHPVLSLEDEAEAQTVSLLPQFFQSSCILPEQEYEQRELGRTIQQALNQLDGDQRAVVVLIDLQDMDYQEAAQLLGIPLGTVKSRLARARRELSQLLKAEK